MSTAPLVIVRRRFGETTMRDAWWVDPARVLGLSTFVVYSTWAAFQGDHYTSGPYLSPFYSPEIFGSSPHSWFGPKPAAWPAWLPFSPALLILPIPALFRLTCYYYRGAYYKAFWSDPPSCTVGEPRKSYWGENSFPLILQNVHRYMLFISVFVLMILAFDAWKAMWFSDPATGPDVVRHRRRHARPGDQRRAARRISFAATPVKMASPAATRTWSRARRSGPRVYRCVSCLNRGHMAWAWTSLFTVGFSDLYVRLCSMGVWSDVRIF